MSAFDRRLGAAVLAALLSTTAAQAQVNAQQVWDSWKAQMGLSSAEGYTIGSESYAGGVLTVTDLGINIADEAGGLVTGTIASLTFTEQADGTVAVLMSETIPFQITTVIEGGGTNTLAMDIVQTGQSLIVSGTPDAMNFDLGLTRMAITMKDMAVDGTVTPGSIVIGFNDVTGSYTTTGAAETMDLTYDLAAASVDMLADIAEGESMVKMSGKIEGVTMTAAGTIPVAAMMTMDPGAFPPGLNVSGGYGFGPMSLTFAATEFGATTQGAIAAAGGNTSFAVSEANVAFDSTLDGMSVDLSGGEMPFPVTISLPQFGIGFGMPMAPAEAPQDFAMRLNLSDLTVNEEIWMMADPAMALPRDPVTARIDLTGTATVMANLMDPAAQAEMEMTGAPPMLPNSISLNELLVRFAGAEISGTGAFTFDLNDMTTFPGMPKPVGSIDLAINGANGLMGKLAQMGLIPQDQVMMAQMMMGMFAVPVGDDMLTSTIEVTADGGILANGQRIQ
jgi:hypothetical protein